MSSALSFLIILAFSSFSRATPGKILIPVSNATCQSEYSWMNNAEGKDPCLTVAYVIAACVGDTWSQPALPPGYSYDSPSGTMITPCYCSWSSYNLMMACTVCQNTSYIGEIETWPSFSENCPSNYKDEMFPQGFVILDNISIPYWASIDPENWTSGLFDIQQAENYAKQDKSDVWPSTLSSSSSSSSSRSSINVGTIVGVTVGGVAGVLLTLIAGVLLYKHRQYQRLRSTTINDAPLLSPTAMPSMNMDAHWASDSSLILSQTQTTRSPSPSLSYLTIQPAARMLARTSVSQPSLYSFNPASPPPETISLYTIENTASLRTDRTVGID